MLIRTISTFPIALGLALGACGEPAPEEGIAVVNEAAASPGPGPAPAETQGQEFVAAVAGGYDFVMASAREAVARGERPETRQLAQRVVADIGGSLEALKVIAGRTSLDMTPTAAATHASDLAILSSASGAPLDRAYAVQQTEALTELVGLIRAYKNGGDNPELKAWAETHQAIVNELLLEMQSLNAELEEAAEG